MNIKLDIFENMFLFYSKIGSNKNYQENI